MHPHQTERRKTAPRATPSSEGTCFVICPIGGEGSPARQRSDKLFKHVIAPAAAANGLTAVRADQIAAPGVITTQVIKQIINADMLVADLTDHNGNVFYELGLRHSFGKPVVQIIHESQQIPFDVGNVRTVVYDLELEAASRASAEIAAQIRAALEPGFKVESPVTVANMLATLPMRAGPQTEQLIEAVLEQVSGVSNAIAELRRTVWRSTDIKDALPGMLQDRMQDLFERYSRELDLLQALKQAGITSVYKRREAAVRSFARDIDEEPREIMVVGSSLKGLLQKDEYREISEKLKFKQGLGSVKVRYMLTHPIFADFRASQENRRPTEIGMEILRSLEMLRDWGTSPSDVRLYLGTPTCFAIKTSRRMLINPYAYTSVSYESPCLALEAGPYGGPAYFFDEFSARHFGAWDTDLAVQFHDFDEVVKRSWELLSHWSHAVEELIDRGKQFR